MIWKLDPNGNAAKLTEARGDRGRVELIGFPWIAPESSIVRRGRRFVEPFRWTTGLSIVMWILFFATPSVAVAVARRPGTPPVIRVIFAAFVLVPWIAVARYVFIVFLATMMRRSMHVRDAAVTYTRSLLRIWSVQRTVPIADVVLRVHEVALQRPGGVWRGYCLMLMHAEFCMALNRYSSRDKAESDVRDLPEALRSRFAGDGVAVFGKVAE